MADELETLLGRYGDGYRDPRLDMDAADVDTRNIRTGMANRQGAKEHELYKALTNLFTTAMVPMAGAHRASGNLPKAISRHMALERKSNNPLVNEATEPFLAAYLMASTPMRPAGGYPNSAFGLLNPLKNHAGDTADILAHLNRTEPKTQTLYSETRAPDAGPPTKPQSELRASVVPDNIWALMRRLIRMAPQ